MSLRGCPFTPAKNPGSQHKANLGPAEIRDCRAAYFNQIQLLSWKNLADIFWRTFLLDWSGRFPMQI
jgi:hypothetical protein